MYQTSNIYRDGWQTWQTVSIADDFTDAQAATLRPRAGQRTVHTLDTSMIWRGI